MDVSIRKIIVPVDFSAPSEAAARFASSLARNLGANLYLIHVLEPRGQNSEYLTRYREARTAMRGLGARVGRGRPITTEVRTGRIDTEITNAIVAYGGDLVVMATHGRTGLPHLLMGSVAEQIIRTAACPVLVMRDSGKMRIHHGGAEPSAPETFARTA